MEYSFDDGATLIALGDCAEGLMYVGGDGEATFAPLADSSEPFTVRVRASQKAVEFGQGDPGLIRIVAVSHGLEVI